ncbi:MAG: DUF2306 domain-containing protein [Pseudomonadota bacterium]
MTLAPLLQAESPVPFHAMAALVAVVLGAVQLLRRRRDTLHRWMGRTWLALMVGVAVSSFWIYGFRVWGPFSPIHLLSIMTLVMLALALLAIRRGDVRGHRNWMIGIYTGALVITGAFTLLPGRTMHLVVFGG